MENTVKNQLEQIKKRKKCRHRAAGVFLVLALLVGAGVTWALKMDGIALVNEAFCGNEEHGHGDSCYERVLVCGEEEKEGHLHSEEAGCYAIQQMLMCSVEEHTHGEACFDKEGNLICQAPEHVHEAACYREESVLMCQIPESDGHTHGETCYELRLICGKEEHVHTGDCYSDRNADLETPEKWETTLPESLSGNWAEDVLAVAKSQNGYRESEKNYILAEDGETRNGYTRYGEWYGNAYGDWCAMFVSFCLNYAEIPEEAVPYGAGCYAWTAELEKAGLYREAGEYHPGPGDLVFFDRDGNGRADHVGLVEELSAGSGETGERIATIEGNYDNKVETLEYNLTDETIIGYGMLPKNPDKTSEETEKREEVYTITAQSGNVTGRVSFDSGVLPEDAELSLSQMDPSAETDGLYGAPIAAAVEETGLLLGTSQFVEVSYVDKEGNPVEPEGTVEVELMFTEPMKGKAETFGGEGTSEMPEAAETAGWELFSVSDSLAERMSGQEETVMETAEDHTLLSAAFVDDSSAVYALAEVRAVSAEVSDSTAFRNAFETNGVVTLGADVTFDAGTSISLPNGRNVTLDLNGHRITVTGNNPLFAIQSGASLKLMDSRSGTETILRENELETGKIGSYTADLLTYYVTEVSFTDAVTGVTEETLVKHQIPIVGGIQGSTGPVFRVEAGGTFTMESGMVYGSTGRAIQMNGNGTVNLAGGYLFGNKSGQNGGAVLASGGTVELSGTVLTGNEAQCGGAVFASETAKINVTGGVISGNRSVSTGSGQENGTHGGGGGLYCEDSVSVTMSGGYLTNNVADAKNYFDGGGGALISDTSSFSLSGGYITGNVAASGGGIRTDWSKRTSVTMSGGYVTGNVARTAEGGGIAVNMGGTASITGGYITNNVTNTEQHWGGGGLFCSNGSDLFVKNVAVAQNSAGGFGGGVAGCSTGRVYICIGEGGAVFENSAEGEHTSGSSSVKSEDHEYAKDSPVFMSNGYQDYFCALNSIVEGKMLGGGAANWTGSADGVPVSAGAEDTLIAAYVMGLTSRPDESGKEAAYGAAKVFVTGNSSYTHGGGILCNGYLVIGNPKDIYVGARLELSAAKGFVSDDGTELPMEDGQFRFTVTDEEGKIAAIGTNNENGEIIFDRRLPFNDEGTFVYYLREDLDESSEIASDMTEYRITVRVGKKTLGSIGEDITRYQYVIDSVKIEKRDGVPNWSPVWEGSVTNHEDGAVKLSVTSDTTFLNCKVESTSIRAVKKWAQGEPGAVEIVVNLYRTTDGETEEICDSQILNEKNNWTYTWNDLPVKDEQGNGYIYSVREETVEGYLAEYTVGSQKEIEEYWIPANELKVGRQYMIVNDTGDQALKIIQAHENAGFTTEDKTAVTRRTDALTIGGATYRTWYENKGIDPRAVFTAQSYNDGIIFKNGGTTNNCWLLVQNNDQNYLKGTSAPNYASYLEFSNSVLYGRKAWSMNGELRKVIYGNGKFNTVGTSESGTPAKLYTLVSRPMVGLTIYTITNTPVETVSYKLDLTKVSEVNPSQVLVGAEFQLFDQETGEALKFSGSAGNYTFSENGETDVLVTSTQGKLMISGLGAGTYRLSETKPPAGYGAVEDKSIVLDENSPRTVAYTIEDPEASYVLPETGDTGIYRYAAGGLFLMLISLGGGYYLSRRRERRDS